MPRHDPIHVLLVDDDKDDAFIVQRFLEKAPVVSCELTWKDSYEEGLETLCAGRFDAALIDYRLGARTGLDLLEAAGERGVRVPLILLTGQGTPEVDRRAMQAGAADYLTKTALDAETLERALRYAHERARSEREIRHQAALLDEAQDAICTYDLEGNLTYWNAGAHRMTGYAKEEIGNVYKEEGCLYGVDAHDIEAVWQTVLDEGGWTGELKQQTKTGDLLFVKSRWTLITDASGAPEAVLVLNTDITEKKRLEKQALRSQRMESIGRLVGGIAHDLGNLLVPIQLGVSVLREHFPGDERAARSLRMIEKSAERGSDMVERVLSFARGVDGERRPLDLAEIAEEVETLVEESFPAGIDFEATLPPDLPPVRGDATQLQQVLVNLSVNARDAMPEEGRLALEAQAVQLAQGDPRLLPDADPGAYVHVCVEDTGEGISPDALDKIFEPFFSTKPSEEGTGLGLSTVYSIVKSHGGFIDVQSTVGVGTRFDLFLPVASEDAKTEEAKPTAAPAQASGEQALPPHSRRRCVLVVDDEESIRQSAAEALEARSYLPLTATHFDEAVRLLGDHAVDAILTDAALADDAGEFGAVRAFRARCPEVPVIACTGRAGMQVAEAACEAGAAHFLRKPFDGDALGDALGKVLGDASGDGRPARGHEAA